MPRSRRTGSRRQRPRSLLKTLIRESLSLSSALETIGHWQSSLATKYASRTNFTRVLASSNWRTTRSWPIQARPSSKKATNNSSVARSSVMWCVPSQKTPNSQLRAYQNQFKNLHSQLRVFSRLWPIRLSQFLLSFYLLMNPSPEPKRWPSRTHLITPCL